MTIENYNFNKELQIRWADLDPLGHVNNAVFVTYFEYARGHYMMHVSKEWNWKKDMFLIANVQVDFLKELTMFDKQPSVHIRTKKIGTKSFELEYLLTSKGKNNEGIIHVNGASTQIMFDTKKRETIAVQDWLKRDILAFEKENSVSLS